MAKRIRNDCGCGGGKNNCVTKKAKEWIEAELKRLDCGCGCKGVKAFKQKYGLVGGKVLMDCPPGWKTDALTCIAPCNGDEFDDPLTCRKKCEPGWVDDGLTCRKPITATMNDCPPGSKDIAGTCHAPIVTTLDPCPAGSRDVAGTCWGPVRQDCVHDCFKHPAPGCRRWECGRLRGAFGEDWGPKWCNSCNLNCGKTCWNVDGITRGLAERNMRTTGGITKQLHERDLRLSGGEVILQAIRGKEIRGRVDFEALVKELDAGLKDLFSENGALARAFDPNKNGVNEAFRKFGDDMKSVLDEVGRKIKEGFDKMGADAKAAFEQFARDAESKFKQFGDDFVKAMKDPDFWIEAIGVMAMIGAAALGMFATVITAGIGAPALVGLMAAAAMVGPSVRMIAAAARNEPIDVLDIAELLVSAGTAIIPGLGPMATTAMKVGTTAASITIACVRTAQDFGMIPSTCIANCPPPPPSPPFTEPPMEPPYPPPAPPPGQKTEEEILALQPANTVNFSLRDPRRDNPDYISGPAWVAQYRALHYSSNPTGPEGGLVPPDEVDPEGGIEVDAKPTPNPNPDPENKDLFPGEGADFSDEFPPFDEGPGADFSDEFPPFDEGPSADFSDEFPPFEEANPLPPSGPEYSEEFPPLDEDGGAEYSDEFPPFESMQSLDLPTYGMEGGAANMPLIELAFDGNEYRNDWGTLSQKKPESRIPVTKAGLPFDPKCYAENNPELLKVVGNDLGKLTTHWIEIGSKQDYDADCGGLEASLARKKKMDEDELARTLLEANEKKRLEEERIANEARKKACATTDRYWNHVKNICDGHRHADGRPNTAAEECTKNNSFWDHSGSKSYCDKFRTPDGKFPTDEERCNMQNNKWHAGGLRCFDERNVDGTRKTISDYCVGLNAFWNGTTCDFTKDRDGNPQTNKERCESTNNHWAKETCVRVETNYKGDYYEQRFNDKGEYIRSAGPTSIVTNLEGFIPIADETGVIPMRFDKPRFMIKCTPSNEYHCTRSKDIKGTLRTDREFCFESRNGKPAKGAITCLDNGQVPWQVRPLPVTNEEIEAKYKSKEEAFKKLDEANTAEIKRLTGNLAHWEDEIKKTRGVDNTKFVYAANQLKYIQADLERLNPGGLTSTLLTNAPTTEPNPTQRVQLTGLGKSKKSLTLYHAEWCHFCQELMPIWKKLGKAYKGIPIIAIEEKQNTSFPVQGYPTIIYRDGKRIEKYEGERTREGLINFLKNKL